MSKRKQEALDIIRVTFNHVLGYASKRDTHAMLARLGYDSDQCYDLIEYLEELRISHEKGS